MTMTQDIKNRPIKNRPNMTHPMSIAAESLRLGDVVIFRYFPGAGVGEWKRYTVKTIDLTAKMVNVNCGQQNYRRATSLTIERAVA